MKLPNIALIIAVFFLKFAYTQPCIGAEGPQHDDCALGMYCSSFSGSCMDCQPCEANDDKPFGFITKCKNDSLNHGIGECPNFCSKKFGNVVPDYSSCENKLVCGNWETVTDRNSSTAKVTWKEPQFKPDGMRNIISIQQVGSNITNGSVFPIGTTSIHYEAVDTYDNTSKAQCTVNITVIDSFDPQITCPDDIIAYTSKSKPQNITWSKPEVSDNSGNWTLELLSPVDPAGSDIGEVPGESTLSIVLPEKQSATLLPGITGVLYEAEDPSGNSNNCSFDIHIKDVSLVCLDNQTTPVVIGGDDNLNFSCNYPLDYEIPYGETRLKCKLYGKDEELLTSCSSVIVRKDDASSSPTTLLTTTWTPTPFQARNQTGLSAGKRVGIVIGVLAGIVLIVLFVIWLLCKQQMTSLEIGSTGGAINNAQNPEFQGLVRGSPSTSSDDNTSYIMNERGNRPGGYNSSNSSCHKPDGTSNIANGDLPNGHDTQLQDKDENDDQVGNSKSSEITTPVGNYDSDLGKQCSQTVDDLMNDQDLIHRLCLISETHRREPLWRSLGKAYGLTDNELGRIKYYGHQDTNPVIRQLFDNIKDKTLGQDERRTIFKLLSLLHVRIKLHVYEGADELYGEIRRWHVGCGCQVCCTTFPDCS